MQDLSSSKEDLNEDNADSSTTAPSKSASLIGPSTSTSSSLPGRSKSSSVPGSSRFSSTPGTSRPSPSQKGVRKRQLLSVMRENQEAYNIYITKKGKEPKLLKALGVDSTSLINLIEHLKNSFPVYFLILLKRDTFPLLIIICINNFAVFF